MSQNGLQDFTPKRLEATFSDFRPGVEVDSSGPAQDQLVIVFLEVPILAAGELPSCRLSIKPYLADLIQLIRCSSV